ncbi:hypothetical protein [Hymenobacter cellulosilyticus]|uniref:Uncharacterized protein n=1 Tax=Hymenobacter cellulosilyticus TaxID=2932248 RepID=A0A8T9Q573_9BACT|nr:hypothetical protein [Hymenobacter cellulosilyticus]UOQ70930.1 hypothetical protein MUN79_19945 [Hymenobacter cellulosilyticus]
MSPELQSAGFWLQGCWVPPFEVGSGQLLRVYIPNFGPDPTLYLGRDWALTLAAALNNPGRLPISKPARQVPYAANFRRAGLWELLRPLTTEQYLIKTLGLSPAQARSILGEVNLPATQLMKNLALVWQKILTIKGLFATHSGIFFDYYEVGAAPQITLLEEAIDQEMRRGKWAVGFDNLQYMEAHEPFDSIRRLQITAGTAS